MIRLAAGVQDRPPELANLENLVLTAVAYCQQMMRRELIAMLGRDTLADLRSFGLISADPKSPRAGAPNTCVTTAEFLGPSDLTAFQTFPFAKRLRALDLRRPVWRETAVWTARLAQTMIRRKTAILLRRPNTD
jgi:chromosome segregation and condensation protein ScpB